MSIGAEIDHKTPERYGITTICYQFIRVLLRNSKEGRL